MTGGLQSVPSDVALRWAMALIHAASHRDHRSIGEQFDRLGIRTAEAQAVVLTMVGMCQWAIEEAAPDLPAADAVEFAARMALRGPK